eukprot:365370-Chlamydomonas_euryale.AAC.16
MDGWRDGDLRCCRATLGVALKHAAHAVLGGLGDLGPRVRLEVERLADDRLEDLLLSVAVERREAAQQDVENDAARPDVRLLAVRAAQHWTGEERAGTGDKGRGHLR